MNVLLFAILLWSSFLFRLNALSADINRTHLAFKRNIDIRRCDTGQQELVITNGLREIREMLDLTVYRLNVLIAWISMQKPFKLGGTKIAASIGIKNTRDLRLLRSTRYTCQTLLDRTISASASYQTRLESARRLEYVKNLAKSLANNLAEQPIINPSWDRTQESERFPNNPINVQFWCNDEWLRHVGGSNSDIYEDTREHVPKGILIDRPTFRMRLGVYHTASHDNLLLYQPPIYLFNGLAPPYRSVINFNPAKFKDWELLQTQESYKAFRVGTANFSPWLSRIPLEKMVNRHFTPTLLHAFTRIDTLMPANALNNSECSYPRPVAGDPEKIAQRCLIELAQDPEKSKRSATGFVFLNVALYLDDADWSTGFSRSKVDLGAEPKLEPWKEALNFLYP